MIDKGNLLKELRLVNASEKEKIYSLWKVGVPASLIREMFNVSKSKLYAICGAEDRVSGRVHDDVRRAVLYSSVPYKVYEVLGAIVVTTEEDIPPSKFMMFPPNKYDREQVRIMMDRGLYKKVKLEDTIHKEKTFSQLLNNEL